MRTSPAAPSSIDEYISGFPGDVQAILGRIRTTIKKAAPGAEEAIRYQMPTFILKGNLISFAAYKSTSGLSCPNGTRQFNKAGCLSGGEVNGEFPWIGQSPST